MAAAAPPPLVVSRPAGVTWLKLFGFDTNNGGSSAVASASTLFDRLQSAAVRDQLCHPLRRRRGHSSVL